MRLAPSLLLALLLLLAAISLYEFLLFIGGEPIFTRASMPVSHYVIGPIFTAVVATLILYYLLSLYERLYRQMQEEIAKSLKELKTFYGT